MKLTKTCLFLSAMTAMLIGMAGSASAQTTTTTKDINVTATVLKSCDITANGIAFAAYDPLAGGNAPTANGSLVINCTSGTAVSVNLTLGSSSSNAPAGTTRAMAQGSDYLGYNLFHNSGLSSAWGGTSDIVSVTAGASASTLTVYGQLPIHQNVPAGDYTDLVVANISF